MPGADLIVVGLGAMGSAVSYHAQRRGVSVLGLDRFDPPHKLGSTHAESRISRLAVAEGEQYLPFVKRSHQIWRDLESHTGETLFYETGGYICTEQEAGRGQRWDDFVVETARIARVAGIDYTVMTPAELRAGGSAINVPDGRRVGFEPTAGIVMAEKAVSTQLALASGLGADLHTTERVVDVVPGERDVVVTTDRGSYRANHVVLAAGPWMRELTQPVHRRQLEVTRQLVLWFEPEDPAVFSVERFPFLMWVGDTIADYFAVFPIAPGGTPAVKVLDEQFSRATDPDTVDRTVSQAEIDDFYERHLTSSVEGLTRNCVRAEVCLYTTTPDEHFLIDADPRSDRVTVMSPCSGHGFKHSTALGEAVAERVAKGTSTLDLEPFRLRR